MALNRENVIRTAEKYVSKGKLEAAIKEYRKVLAENPNDANTLNRVGDLYARIERFGEAVKLFTQIAEQYTRDGFFVKAIAIYKKIIKLDPTSLPVYERLAELYHKQGLLNEARTQYQVLADYYQKHDNAASAITIYQKMAQMEPENPTFHLKLAELFESQQLSEKAIASFKQLADLLIVNGSVDEATQVYLRALEVSSEDLGFVREAVSGLHDSGHVGSAAKVLARAVELNPAASGIAEDVGMSTQEPASEADDPDAPEPAAFDEPLPAAADDTFDVPETTFADVPSFEDAGAEPLQLDEDVFSFSLDDDEVPESLVQPPADLPEAELRSGSAETGTSELEIELPVELDEDETIMAASREVAAALSAAADETPAEPAAEDGVFDLADAAEFDGEISFDEIVEPAQMEEAEVDWSPDGVEEIEIEPPPELAAADDGLEIVLEVPDSATTETDEPEPFAPDAFELEELATDEPPAEPAAEPQAAARPEEDLLAEARVFAKYGLQEKAQDRLNELLEIHPNHLEGLELRTRIHLEAGRHQETIDSARDVRRVAEETANLDSWHELRDDLLKAGYTVDGDDVAHQPAGAKPGEDDRIAQLLEDLSLEDFELPMTRTPPGGFEPVAVETTEAPAASADAREAEPEAAAPPVEPDLAQTSAPATPASARIDLDGTSVEELLGLQPPAVPGPPAEESPARASPAAVDEPAAAEPTATPPAAAAATGAKQVVSLVDELGLEDLQDELSDLVGPQQAASRAGNGDPTAQPATEAPLSEAAGAQATETAADALDETGMSWLDDSSMHHDTAEQTESIFDEEDDFFDLAAELERELTADELHKNSIPQPQEQSLEEIIEGFKQGVAENLSEEDYETHFNLGIAYREMGLLDEAIGEFQLASKDERYIVDCSSLLGLCFLDKGLPELAVRWYRRGLEAPSINEEATMGLLYDMVNAYLSIGDSDAAYKTFVEVYGLNSNYRDVSNKLQELQA